jgi:hypothetical protein
MPIQCLETAGVRNNRKHGFLMIKILFLGIFLYTPLIAGSSSEPVQHTGLVSGNTVPIGEKLDYRINWDPPWYLFFFPSMHAGDAELQIVGETEYKNRKALKIVFTVHSSGILARLSGMEIDDEFIFLTEPDTLCTLSVSKKIREGKRKRQIDVDYLPESRQLHFREYDESVSPAVLKKDVLKEDIPLCVQDPFSALYSIRQLPFHPDFEHKSNVGHDDIVKEIQTRVEKLEALDTESGKVSAWKVKTVALMGGLFKNGGQFKIWFSADEKQVPLQFEAKVSLGRVLGKLKNN